MKFFLYLPDMDLREKITFALEGTFDATVVEAKDRQSANAILTDKVNNFDLIICNHGASTPRRVQDHY